MVFMTPSKTSGPAMKDAATAANNGSEYAESLDIKARCSAEDAQAHSPSPAFAQRTSERFKTFAAMHESLTSSLLSKVSAALSF